MKTPRFPASRRSLAGTTLLAACVALAPSVRGQQSATAVAAAVAIDASNWGAVTAPVFNTSEAGVYAGAELFAGPNKFDNDYFHGVLPNGRIVRPAGQSAQVGMNPLGAALTPDGRFLVTSNDDERDGGFVSLKNPTNIGGYSLSVIDTTTMNVVSQAQTSARYFIGLALAGAGPYTLYASGGGDNNVKVFTISASGAINATPAATIPISPILPGNAGYVSNYTPAASFNTKDANGNLPPAPTGFSRTGSTKITFPAGSALSPDGRFLYVACNGDNSVAVISTATNAVVKQVPVGFFPYGVSVSADGAKIAVTDWGMTAYKFANPTYDSAGNLSALGVTGQDQPDGFYVPVTSTAGLGRQTSSVHILSAPGGDGAQAAFQTSIYEGKPLDALYQVGDTHPCASAVVRRGSTEVLYIAKANSDSLGRVQLNTNRKLADFDLSPVPLTVPGATAHPVHGAYPNALVASADGSRLYVAEAGTNSVAVLDTTDALQPRLLGRIPTGWYPASLALSADGSTLFVVNAKGIGEDINPATPVPGSNNATGVESFTDGNFIFGTVQKVNLAGLNLENTTALGFNYAVQPAASVDTRVVPLGGGPSAKIKHVFFILHENKAFDSMLGNQSGPFGPFASTTFNQRNGTATTNGQYTGVSVNTQTLATTFATAVNYYSDSEESDAGHQFAASGTATDYTEKTLLVKTGRGLLVNKNFEPEDYPEGGYIFNNAARNGVSFKDYGAMIRIAGTDTGSSAPTTLNDPPSGNLGYPRLKSDNFSVTNPLVNAGDVDSPVSGLGQSYFLSLPVVAVLGTNNPNGEPRLDRNYPGYNFNISDQRRAKEFCQDFDRMAANGTLPQFVYIYQPNDHTGGVQAPNAAAVGSSGLQQIADGDVALGMVVQHLMSSPVYYDAATDTGSAIFITYDDAQSSLDHIHEHRTPLVVVSPFAKPAYVAKRHYVTASVVKTEELMLGLPPNNYGDLFATDLRDLFQPTYNGITASQIGFSRTCQYEPSREGRRIWTLVKRLDTSAPDRDSRRLGRLLRLSAEADQLHADAAKEARRLGDKAYLRQQKELYKLALNTVRTAAPRRDSDD